MNRERIIRLVAGSFVLISVALSYWVHPNWIGLAIFVGVNLVQSSITRWCLMETLLKKWSVKSAEETSKNNPCC